MDLPLVWAVLIAVAILLYVVLDGFDLGIGVLFPLADDAERDAMTASVAPVWDANETWLVLGGGGLLAAFPLAYAVLMPALYIPILIMLLALIFRGVAFEFRAHGGSRGRPLWSVAFAAGSLVAVLAQGFVLGAFVQGIRVEGRAFAGGPFDWLTPFTVLTALSLVAGYALLGATWLIAKAEGTLQAKARRWSRALVPAIGVALALVSLATLSVNPAVEQRWGFALTRIEPGRLLPLLPVPLLGAAALAGLFVSAGQPQRHVLPYVCAVAVFLSGYAGLAISIAPFVVPYQVTLWDAAARENALQLMLVGVAALLPLILAYTAYTYWIFRGKVRPEEHGYG
jgi:cytochrome d ubiquinol oxidase subunit II